MGALLSRLNFSPRREETEYSAQTLSVNTTVLLGTASVLSAEIDNELRMDIGAYPRYCVSYIDLERRFISLPAVALAQRQPPSILPTTHTTAARYAIAWSADRYVV